MPTLEDIACGSDKTKQQLQDALLALLKGNPDILESVTKSSQSDGNPETDRSLEVINQMPNQDVRRPKRSQPFPEVQNTLNQQPSRDDYQWNLSDNGDGIDSAWSTTTKNMSPRELVKWRRSLFSVYVGHLPCDISKRELVQLFSEVGSVQDIHIQPGTESRSGYTYGFIRFGSIEECRDAVSELHGRILGNRTLSVEYACETKQRLQIGGDADDLPLDRKDKLLRGEYPSVNRRPMLDAEAQEKMVLWKLRSSTVKHSTSHTGFVKENMALSARQEGSKEETFMNQIQEVVKKVVGLQVDTRASPSVSESSPFSSWIIQGNCNNFYESKGSEQLHPTEWHHKYEDDKVILQSTEALTVKLDQEETFLSPLEHSSAGTQCSAVGLKMNMSEVQEPPIPCNGDLLSTPVSQINGTSNLFEADMSPPSPEQDNSCNSEEETSTSGSVSLASLSPERPLKEHCQYCHVSDSNQPGQTPGSAECSSLQQSATEHCVHESCHEEAKICNGDSNEHAEQDMADNHIHQGEGDGRQWNGRSVEGVKMGLCSFESSVQRYPSYEEHNRESVQHIPAESPSAVHQTYAKVPSDHRLEETAVLRKETPCGESDIVNICPDTLDIEAHGSGNLSGQTDSLPSRLPTNVEQVTTRNIRKNVEAAPVPQTGSVAMEMVAGSSPRMDHTASNEKQDLQGPTLGEVKPSVPSTSYHTPIVSQVPRPVVNGPFCGNPAGQPILPPYMQFPNVANILGPRGNQHGLYRPPFGNPQFYASQLLKQRFLNQVFLQQQQLFASGLYRQPFHMGGNYPRPRADTRDTGFGHQAGRGQGWRSPHVRPNIGHVESRNKLNNCQRPHMAGPGYNSPVTVPGAVNAAPKNDPPITVQDSTSRVELEKSKTEPSSPRPSEKSSPVKLTLEKTSPSPSPFSKEGDGESPGSQKVPLSRLSKSELHLRELKGELQSILKDNEKLRRCVYWKRSERDVGPNPEQKQEAIENLIHLKEVRLQKEKEIITARNTEQELLYEREKLEAAFDQQLKKELETEQQIGDTKNRILLARMESELLPLYQQLNNTKEATNSSVLANDQS